MLLFGSGSTTFASLALCRNSSFNFEWRKKDEPEQSAEFVIQDALKKAGYHVDRVFVYGVWDEDKPKFPGGPWDETRLPHEEIAK